MNNFSVRLSYLTFIRSITARDKRSGTSSLVRWIMNSGSLWEIGNRIFAVPREEVLLIPNRQFEHLELSIFSGYPICLQ